MKDQNTITKELLASALPEGAWVEHHSAIGSTNLRARALAEEGAPHLSLVWADSQTAGRGRFDRRFFSPEGCGFYFSLILRPSCAPEELSLLTPCAAVALAEAVEAVCGIKTQIKWVNDLWAEGKKVAGILTEAAFSPEGTPRYAILGIGINVLSTPLPKEIAHIATSLEAAAGIAPDKAALATEILSRLAARSATFASRDFLGGYRHRSALDGKTVTVTRMGQTFSARVLGIGDAAELLLDRDGEQIALSSGEVVSLHDTPYV